MFLDQISFQDWDFLLTGHWVTCRRQLSTWPVIPSHQFCWVLSLRNLGPLMHHWWGLWTSHPTTGGWREFARMEWMVSVSKVCPCPNPCKSPSMSKRLWPWNCWRRDCLWLFVWMTSNLHVEANSQVSHSAYLHLVARNGKVGRLLALATSGPMKKIPHLRLQVQRSIHPIFLWSWSSWITMSTHQKKDGTGSKSASPRPSDPGG